MTTPTYPDRYSVDCLEDVCAFRGCMSPGHNKGTFSPGRGYTSYHSQPKPVCLTRHLRGCPHPLPVPDVERVRCCSRPKYPAGRRKQATCTTCGATRPGWVGKLLNKLPTIDPAPGDLPVDPAPVDTQEDARYVMDELTWLR